jgi:hypothetical protein
VFRENIEEYIKNNNNIETTELNILNTLINVYQPEDNNMTASQRDAANRADVQNAPLGGKSKTRKNKSKKSKTKRTKKSKTKRSKK